VVRVERKMNGIRRRKQNERINCERKIKILLMFITADWLTFNTFSSFIGPRWIFRERVNWNNYTGVACILHSRTQHYIINLSENVIQAKGLMERSGALGSLSKWLFEIISYISGDVHLILNVNKKSILVSQVEISIDNSFLIVPS